MDTYYTVVVPWVPAKFRTKWHPLESDKDPSSPFHTNCRGAFKTEAEAIAWGRTNLDNGSPYTVKAFDMVPLPEDGPFDSDHYRDY